uniref:phosphatidylserine decarboxylase n=1 Tax=Trichuris muris TaxID=70415 RepID=A0A5S6R0A4_TRIMR
MAAIATVGSIGVAYALYSAYVREEDVPWKQWKVRIYRSLPLGPFSRVWGTVNSIEIPLLLRRPILGAYARMFNCDLMEAEMPDLRSYSSLQQFFCRSLRSDLRPISTLPVVSPADGIVQWCGTLEDGCLSQVKGITYPLEEFFGRQELPGINLAAKATLFSCIVYLAPGDYHGFHSPTDWEIAFRRHISGYLLSVGQRIVRRVSNLYALNERVHLVGQWRYGFFSLSAVGATNVGSINVVFEDDLRTNRHGVKRGSLSDRTYTPTWTSRKGEKLGDFKFGSSVVLVFEAPSTFQFSVTAGRRIKYGEPLGLISADS